jgi:ankyrin repeat protein
VPDGGCIKIRRMNPKTPEQKLWHAARVGDCAAIRRLVVDGADIDARDSAGRTALHIATQYSHLEARKTLMAAKEMKSLAALGVSPMSGFSARFKPRATGTE